MAEETNAASEIAGRPMSGKKKLFIWTLCILSIVVLFLLNAMTKTNTREEERNLQADQVGAIGGSFVPVLPEPKVTEAPKAPPTHATQIAARPGNAPVPPPGSGGGFGSFLQNGMTLPTGPRPNAKIRHFQAQGAAAPQQSQRTGGPTESTMQVSDGPSGSGRGDALDNKLAATADQDTVVATMLPDRHLFLTMGTSMPCISEQPINTDVPGPFKCKVRGNVMSTSGAVTLIDDGSTIFGRTVEDLQRGKRRTFGLVTRVETTKGCLIKLRAPVGDQLGTPGLDGEIDTHFFERFQSVAILALFDAASQAAAIAASEAIGGDNGISFNQIEAGGKSLGEGTAGDDLKIPPTLKRAQAQRMLIMVNQDIDMRQCYNLRIAK